MRQGINLGLERDDRKRSLFRLVWPIVVVATLVHGLRARRAGEELAALREEVLRAEEGLGAEALGTDDAIVRRLREISASGVTAGHSATSILALIDSSLPPDMTLVALTIHPIPPSADLVVEATAHGSEGVTLFQRNVAGSSLVSSTTLLEERRSTRGLEIRLRVGLRAR